MSTKKPNIVFILSDDQGAWALGCAGNAEISTPHLDALAGDGARLENFFCVSPVCSPARASLLTGHIPSRHGVHDYLHGTEVGNGAVDFLAGQRLFTDELADAGYRLGLSGKWHLGANDRPRRGFSHWYALQGGGSPYRQATMYRDGEPEVVTDYLTDAITDDALGFITDAAAAPEPFFLALSYTAPHKPWAGQHPPQYESLYKDCAFTSCPQEATHPWTPTVDGVPIGGEADVRAALVGYFASVTAMDAGIGRVLGLLEDLGLGRETLVVFSSDNGFNCGHHGIWGKGNGTFPQNMYDSSVKVPAIFSFPGRIPGGQVRTELLSAYDIATTMLELVGLDGTAFEHGPGRSFADLLLGPELAPGSTADAPERAAAAGDGPVTDSVVVFDEYGPVRMIRSRDWKYVHRYPHGPHELYDLQADPDERTNLADEASHQDRLAGLRRDMQAWFDRYSVPEFNGSALPVAGAGQTGPLGVGALDAFTPPNWDGTPGRSSPSALAT